MLGEQLQQTTIPTDVQHPLIEAFTLRGPFCHTEFKCERSQSHDRNTLADFKKRKVEMDDSTTLHSTKVLISSPSSFAMVQEGLLGNLVAPFLTDRETFNNFSCASRELHEVCKSLPAPWPRQTLPVDTVAQSLCFSPCGQMLACCSGTFFHIWNRQTGSKQVINTSSPVTSLTFSPDGKYLASGHRSQTSPEQDFVLRENNEVCVVRLWNARTLVCTKIFRNDQHGGIFTIAFSPDSQLIAAGGADQCIRLWNVQDGSCRITLHGHSSWIYCLRFSPDGKYLASAGEEETSVLLWDLNNFQVTALPGHTESVHCVAFTPDGKYLLSGSDDETICLWDVHHDLTCTVLKGNLCSVWTIACSPDSKTIVSGSRNMEGNQVIRVWDLNLQRSVSVIQGHHDYITSLAFSPSGRTLASGSFDCSVRTWNIAAENAKSVYPNEKAEAKSRQ